MHVAKRIVPITAALLCLQPGQAQTAAEVIATLELLPTSSACSLTVTSALDFARVESPGTSAQSGWLTIDPTASAPSALRTAHQVTPRGQASAGAATVGGYGVTAYEVAVTPAFANTEIPGRTHTLGFAGSWAQSAQAQGPYEAISGTTFSVPGHGKDVGPRHFRFGGTISQISAHQSAEEYVHTFSVTVTCP